MTITDVALDLIDANPWQTRDHEDAEHLAEVAASIAKVGLLQIPVGRMAGERVQLAFGHTRLAAMRKLVAEGFDVGGSDLLGTYGMPVDVRVLTDEQMFELAVRENLERKDLTPIEEARAMARYRDDFHKTSEEIGELFHLSGSAVRNKLRLLELPAPVQARIEGGQIGEGIARQLLAVQRLAPDRVEKLVTDLVDGGYQSDVASDEIERTLQREAFCMLSGYDARRTGGDDDDPDDKVRAGKGLWPLRWKAAVKGPGVRKLTTILAEKGWTVPAETLEPAIEALTSGTDVDGVVQLFGLPHDVATWIRQYVAPPPCSACDFHQVLNGSHFCGIKPCWLQKRHVWIEAETRKASKRLGIAVYDSAADGKDVVAAPTEYDRETSHQRLHSSWQRLLDAKDSSLRVRGQPPGYSKEPGTGSYVVQLVRVGKAAVEAKKRQLRPSSSGDYDFEAAQRKRDQEHKRDQASMQLVSQTAPILAEALVNHESVAGLELIWGRLREYHDRTKLPDKKALRLAVLRERIAAAVLYSGINYDVRMRGPQATAKHLQGVATALGVKLPKAWTEMVADLEAGVSTETPEAKKAA